MSNKFFCFQIRSLDPDRFYDPDTRHARLAGTMPQEKMAQVVSALKTVLDISE